MVFCSLSTNVLEKSYKPGFFRECWCTESTRTSHWGLVSHLLDHVLVCPTQFSFKHSDGLNPTPSTYASIPAVSAWWSTPPAVHGVRWSSVTGHLHPELPPVEERAVHGVHSVLGVALVEEAHEGETPALLGVPVPGDVHVSHAAVLLENPPEGLGRSTVSQVIHFQRGHSLHVWRRPSVAHVERSGDKNKTSRLRH